MKLSAIQVKSAKPKEKDYKLFDGEGLFLLVKKTGVKSWRLKYRFLGKEKLLTIGTYPIVSLLEAREEKVKAKRLIADNIDPVSHKREQKLATADNLENTFEAIALEWHENKLTGWSDRYAGQILDRLKDDIFPYIGKMPIKDIEPPALLEVIRKIEKRGAFDLAKRQLQKCGEIFRYAIATGRGVRDPSRDIREALKPSKSGHFASIKVEELPEFLHKLQTNDARLYGTTQNAMWLMLLTFVRTSELINAKWEEIDFDKKLWTIPAERMKMKKEHLVPLSDMALSIFEKQQLISGNREHVFASPIRPKNSISNNTILKALKLMGYQGKMTGHGFRALAMGAIKQELGYRHEVIDRQLAHLPKNKIDRAYDRADFLQERTKMMQDWADYIKNIKA
ncbi:MAG: integrase [Rickettsiales bacterium]|nr:integrase [Rickettsiales bacterium]|tara:strand:- start:1814 stop:2998 length:1185 start_codon:yes stop_codon:yes gene_type:complete